MAFDILIKNALVVTANQENEIFDPGFVAITGQNIVRTGRMSEAEDLPLAGKVIDASGGIVMPGLVNTHTHLPMTLFRGLADDLPLMMWLHETIFPAEAEHIDEKSAWVGSLLACAEMLLSGTTTCCDGYFVEDKVAQAAELAGMRAICGHGIIDFPAPGVPDPKKNIKVAADFVRKWLNRSSRVSPSLFCHSPYTCSAETLVASKRQADELGVLFQIHVAETKTELAQIKDQHDMTPVAYLYDLGILDENTLLVHTIWVNDADIEIIARTGATVSVATQSEMKLASGVAPIPKFVNAQIPVGLGTDSAASNNTLDMFREMDATAKIHKVFAQDPTVCNASQVFSLATRMAAKSIGLSEITGSLETGLRADVVILDADASGLCPVYNPVSHLVYAAMGGHVRHVVVDGKLVVEDKRLLTVDLSEIIEKARSMAQAVSSCYA